MLDKLFDASFVKLELFHAGIIFGVLDAKKRGFQVGMTGTASLKMDFT